jgi:hypothetical protein
MKANRFVSLGVAMVTMMLMVGSLASQAMIVAEAFGGRGAPPSVSEMPRAQAAPDIPVQTMDKIVVVAHRDNAIFRAAADKRNG